MAVYVDDMRAPYGRLIMCHMVADTDDELHAMADAIGVARRWHQKPPKVRNSHYDIALSKRALAVAAGAVEITWKQTGAMCRRRRLTGELGKPENAMQWSSDRAVAARLADAGSPGATGKTDEIRTMETP